jgi:hypothetical protein
MQLGLLIAMRRLEGPTLCLIFIGIEVDTWAMEPLGKLRELQALLEAWLSGQQSCTRDEPV